MAEETNAGVTVFVAEITSMCSLGCDGIAALLYACSLTSLLLQSSVYLPLSSDVVSGHSSKCFISLMQTSLYRR